MFSGPMFRHEYQASNRKRRPFIFRSVVTVVLVLAAMVIGLACFLPSSGENFSTRLLYFGRALLIATICIELFFLIFFVPAHVGGTIAEERQKDTLPLLLLTRLTPIEIVLTKALARWLPAASLVVTCVPALVAAAWSAGLEFQSMLAFLVLLSSSAFMASLAVLASAQREQEGTARAQASAWIFGWLIGPPSMSIIPVATGSLWGDLLAELKRICALIAPSSPLSLFTDNAWYYGRASLEGRVAVMIGLQALFGLLAFVFAAGRLKAREKNPNWADPTRGYRPPCGDDPIFWREYELPFRRGGASPMVLLLRTALILVQSILISVLALLANLIALAVPIGLLVATLYYGFAAFEELREYGFGGTGPFEARTRFNLLIRAATGMLAFFPTMLTASLITARITTERDKKTWDAFLMTPLTGEEILQSKARVAVRLVWQSAWPLPILWAIGIAFGVVTPLGVALAAIDMLAATWANVALGLYLGIRPGTTNSVQNRNSLATLGYVALHLPFLFVSLASPRELAIYAASLDARLRWGLFLAGLAVPIATGLFARRLTRVTFERFDEWVGRPIAGGARNVQG